jgi:hypothetical protein
MSITLGGRYVVYFNNTEYLRYDPARRQCILTFIEDTDPLAKFWLMGDSFLRGFYMMNQTVGLAGRYIDLGPPPSTSSSSSSSDEGSISTAFNKENAAETVGSLLLTSAESTATNWLLWSCILGVAFLAIIIFGTVYLIRMRNKEKLNAVVPFKEPTATTGST